MAQQFTIDLQDDAILAAIDGTISALQRPRQLMQDIGDRLQDNARQRFKTKSDPQGQPWAPLSEATKDIYASDWFINDNPAFKNGIPGTLLERTRALVDSLAFNAGDDFVDIGTSRATKGGKWQVGWLMETGTRKMPRRGILTADPKTGELGADDQADLLAIVDDYLGNAFG